MPYLLELTCDKLLLLTNGLKQFALFGQKEVPVLDCLQLELPQILLRKKDSVLLHYQLGTAEQAENPPYCIAISCFIGTYGYSKCLKLLGSGCEEALQSTQLLVFVDIDLFQ